MEAKYLKATETALKIFDLYESEIIINFSDVFKTFNGGTFQSKFYVPLSNNKLITIKNVDDDGLILLQFHISEMKK